MRHRSRWTGWAAAGGLVIAGAAGGHERAGIAPDAGALADVAIEGHDAFTDARAGRDLTRSARESTIFLPGAEFLFAPSRGAGATPR